LNFSSIRDFAYRVLKVGIQIFLLFCTTVLVNTGLLYVIRIFKLTYFETATGRRFSHLFQDSTRIINDLAQRDLFSFAVDISIIALWVCLGISAAFQLLHIARFFYQPRGLVGKLVYWGLPLTGIVAFYLKRDLHVGSWISACIVALIPTLIIFPNAFRFAFELLPEIGDIVHKFIGRENDR